MTDVLIRNVPKEVVAAIDAKAERLGISRNEYVRRRLTEDANRSNDKVTVEDMRHFAELFQDLKNPEVMRKAWE